MPTLRKMEMFYVPDWKDLSPLVPFANPQAGKRPFRHPFLIITKCNAVRVLSPEMLSSRCDDGVCKYLWRPGEKEEQAWHSFINYATRMGLSTALTPPIHSAAGYIFNCETFDHRDQPDRRPQED